MPKETAIDPLISTKELINELVRRNDEIIIIRNDIKNDDYILVQAKTGIGEHANPEVGFDLIIALSMLHSAQTMLVAKHFKLETEDEDDNDDPQDGIR